MTIVQMFSNQAIVITASTNISREVHLLIVQHPSSHLNRANNSSSSSNNNNKRLIPHYDPFLPSNAPGSETLPLPSTQLAVVIIIMGKKFGTNSKAEEGRARKLAAKEAAKEKQLREKQREEDKRWEQGTKDTSKQAAEEAKRLEKLIRKQEARAIEEQERRELEKLKPAKSNKLKVPESSTQSSVKSPSLNWSLSRSISSDGSLSSGSIEAFSASNIDDALLILESANTSSTSVQVEKHPERRVKAAFAAYEARELPKLKAEYPTLRHTQLMERLHKMWQKAPENPFNQLHVAHNVTREEQAKIVQEDIDRNLERLRINWLFWSTWKSCQPVNVFIYTFATYPVRINSFPFST